jgi:hypothetical protein
VLIPQVLKKPHLPEKGDLVEIIDLADDPALTEVQAGAVLQFIFFALHIGGRTRFGMFESACRNILDDKTGICGDEMGESVLHVRCAGEIAAIYFPDGGFSRARPFPVGRKDPRAVIIQVCQGHCIMAIEVLHPGFCYFLRAERGRSRLGLYLHAGGQADEDREGQRDPDAERGRGDVAKGRGDAESGWSGAGRTTGIFCAFHNGEIRNNS